MMTQMKKQTEKGFTLIELMIVVAIIGILAAIAIPQFSSYRTKAFNSAAMSDLHTARLAEEAVFADYQQYGSSAITGAVGTTAGALLIVTGNIVTATATEASPITLSNNVKLIAAVDAIATAAYATIVAKHDQGDKFYAGETDQSGTMQKTGTAGTAMVAANAEAATAGTDAVTAGYTVM